MRKIETLQRRTATGEVRKAIIYYHADWKEYFVRFWINDVLQRKVIYPADDLTDAYNTADYFVNR